MRRIAIRFPLKDGNCEKFVMSCAPVNTGLMKTPVQMEESASALCDQHQGLFWLSFMAGCHLKRISKSSFLIKLYTKHHFLYPHALI